MTVILLFLVLGGIILVFFGELMLTGVAVALLTVLLIGRLDLSETWAHRAWVFVTAPPISLQAAIVWTGYFAIGALLLWMLTRKGHGGRSPSGLTPSLGATASESPINVDMVALERELWAESPPDVEPPEGLPSS
jgi:hypothetical protein